MSLKALAIVSGVLGTIWLASIGVLLFFVAGLASVPWLLGAAVAQSGVFCVAAALLLVTNTRRPRGIDPDVPIGPTLGFDQATLDAFSLTTDEVLKHEKKRVKPDQIALDDGPKERSRRSIVIDERGEPYGRRRTDIPIADIKRTIEAVREIKGSGGSPQEIISVPEWAKALLEEGEQAQEQGDSAAHDVGGRSDSLDLQPIGDGTDRTALPDDRPGSGRPGLLPEHDDRA